MKSLAGLVAAIFLSSTALANDHKATKEESLFKRIGGKAGIEKVVDEFVNNCAHDEKIQSFFAATAGDEKKLKHFKKNLVDQICQAVGGPCKYKGKDMKTAHSGMGVSSAHFDALVADLTKALEKFNVKQEDQKAIVDVLGPMKKDIVDEKSAANTAGDPHTN